MTSTSSPVWPSSADRAEQLPPPHLFVGLLVFSVVFVVRCLPWRSHLLDSLLQTHTRSYTQLQVICSRDRANLGAIRDCECVGGSPCENQQTIPSFDDSYPIYSSSPSLLPRSLCLVAVEIVAARTSPCRKP